MRIKPAGARTGFTQALRYAVAGLHHVVRTQRTFRIQLLCAAVIAALAAWLRLSALEAAVVALAIVAVLVAELFNTGVEAMVDLLVERNHHDLARLAKDIAAAAVVTSVVGAILAGGLVLGPPLAGRVGVSPLWSGRLSWAGAVVVLAATAVLILGLIRRPAPDEVSRGAGRGTS